MDTPETLWLDWKPPSAREQKSGTDKTDKTSTGGRGLIAELFKHTEDPAPETAKEQEQEAARQLLNRLGVRILHDQTPRAIGVWSDIDSPQIRAALLTLEMGHLPVRYLDGDVPLKYKARKVPGEPVSIDIRKAMEEHPETPWEIREKLWKPVKPMAWSEYEKRCLDACFEEARAKAGSAEAAKADAEAVCEKSTALKRSEAKQRGLWKPESV